MNMKWNVGFGLCMGMMLVACSESSSGTGNDEGDSSVTGSSSIEGISSLTGSSSEDGVSSSESVVSSSAEIVSSSASQTGCSYGPDQVVIAASGQTFQMGANTNVLLADAKTNGDSTLVNDMILWGIAESPVHAVTISKNFKMDKTEVTQSQMLCALNAAQNDTMPGYVQTTWQAAHDMAHFAVGDLYPAFGITMDQAAVYANARSVLEGLSPVYTIDYSTGSARIQANYSANGYRLPTEAEWEFAARGGIAKDFYWDKNWSGGLSVADSNLISSNAVWTANSGSLEGSADFGPHAVATKLPNAYGLYDMLGNISEYVNSDGMDAYTADAVTDPRPTGDLESLLPRGGNWANQALSLRVSSRSFDGGPSYPQYSVGFRLVRNAQ